MKISSLLVTTSVGTVLAASSMAAPLQPMPKESGFSGAVVAGVSATALSSNMVGGLDGDLGEQSISSLSAGPDSESSVAPFITGEVNYTFAESRTQIFLGSELEDLVRYDLAFQLGVRQELSEKGTVYGGFLFSALPTTVYADPYLTDTSREETDRSSTGVRLGWQDIMGSRFGAEISSREIELDKEQAAAQLVADGFLTDAQQRLLLREGTHSSLTFSYKHIIDKQQLVVPEINYELFDLDGEAASKEQYGASISYFYNTQQWSLVASGFFSTATHEETNPIYGLDEESDSYGASVVFTYHNLFDVKPLSLLTSVAAGESDSTINFYDADVVNGTLGVIYRF